MVQLRELYPGIEEGNTHNQPGDFGKAQGYVENGVEGYKEGDAQGQDGDIQRGAGEEVACGNFSYQPKQGNKEKSQAM